MIERRIKELAIALEALSRINHPTMGNAFKAIEQLLDTAISQARRENRQTQTPPDTDDDIPF